MKSKIICMTLLVEKSPQALPLGAACIASAIKSSSLTKDFCDVSLLSATVEDDDFRKAVRISSEAAAELLAGKIEQQAQGEFKKRICCFSVFVWNRVVLELVAGILQNKGWICIAGGPEVTAHPEVFTAFDYVVSGEGEIKVPGIIAGVLGVESEGGSGCEAVGGSPDLNSLASPYLDGTIDPAEYGGALWELARGCPFKCSYCYESKGEKTVRLFPMERISKELDLFARKKVSQVFVLDPTYNANKQRAIELLNMMAKKTPDTFYYFEARAEFIDRQMAKAFTKLPCAVQIGLQSADENVLRLVHRPFNRKQFVRNIGLLNEEGVIFGFDLIYGLPGDTFRSFKDSIDFAIGLYPNNLEIFCLSVLPGTDIFDRAQELKLTYDSNPPYHVIHTDKFSQEDLKNCDKIAKACSFFYNDGRAVPWFNTILHALKMKASQFFVRFAQEIEKNPKLKAVVYSDMACSHSEIELQQLEFVKKLFSEKNLNRLFPAAHDVIVFNGAISRKTDTGKSEKIQLNYPVEYIDSEYSFDLDFFAKNVKMKSNWQII